MAEGEYVQPAPPNLVTFSVDHVAPPSPLYVQRDDVLTIELTASSIDTVAIVARLMLAQPEAVGQPAPSGGPAAATGRRPEGMLPIKTIEQDLVVSAAAVPALFPINLAEGYLLSLTAVARTTTYRGQVYVRAWLTRAKAGVYPVVVGEVLFCDYVTKYHVAGWPGGRQFFPTEGPGYLSNLGVTAPAAGADWTWTVPAYLRVNVYAISAKLVTNSSAATRIPRIQIGVGGSQYFWQGAPSQSIAASITAQISCGAALLLSTVDTTTVVIALPSPCPLYAGVILGSSTLNIQSGDQWSNINVLCETWVDQG
jgi:hypothetical protein